MYTKANVQNDTDKMRMRNQKINSPYQNKIIMKS